LSKGQLKFVEHAATLAEESFSSLTK